MKKKRYLPFGYRMEQGQVLPVPEESDLLRHLFSAYLEGASLRQTAELAMRSGIPYHENGNGWSKCTVSRILADERYWDCKQFPPVIDAEMGRAVLQRRKDQASAPCPLPFLRKKVLCGKCGSLLCRDSRSSPGIVWKCQRRTVWATDGSGASAGNQKEAARALPDAGALPFVRGA